MRRAQFIVLSLLAMGLLIGCRQKSYEVHDAEVAETYSFAATFEGELGILEDLVFVEPVNPENPTQVCLIWVPINQPEEDYIRTVQLKSGDQVLHTGYGPVAGTQTTAWRSLGSGEYKDCLELSLPSGEWALWIGVQSPEGH